MLLRHLVLGLVAGLLISNGAARADTVITDHGIFPDCTTAGSYRDGALFSMLEGAFRQYDFDRETRIAQALTEFERHREDAEAAYARADAVQKLRISVAIGKFLFMSFAGSIDVGKLPKSITDGYTKVQLDTFETVINASNNLKTDVAAGMITGDLGPEVLTDQAVSITLDILARIGGPAAAVLAGAGTVTVDTLDAYWATQPLKDVASAEAAMFAEAIQKLRSTSQAQVIASVNRVKNQIDEACN